MGSSMNINHGEFERLMGRLQELQDPERIMFDALNNLGMRFVRKVKLATPVGETGQLRRNWSIDNSEKTRTGSIYTLKITNPTEYAEYVEYGHRQTPGRFVPKLGKRLKQSWVPGQFFAARSEAQIQQIADKVVQTVIEKEIREALGD